jgi:hypothetical protein
VGSPELRGAVGSRMGRCQGPVAGISPPQAASSYVPLFPDVRAKADRRTAAGLSDSGGRQAIEPSFICSITHSLGKIRASAP